jgi:hypothetical protein
LARGGWLVALGLGVADLAGSSLGLRTEKPDRPLLVYESTMLVCSPASEHLAAALTTLIGLP